MISLRRSIQEHDRTELRQLFEKAMECYRGAIEAVKNYAVEVSPEDLKGHQTRLSRLQRSLSAENSVESLDRGRDDLNQEIEAYNGRISRFLTGCRKEVREILGLVREVTTQTSTCNSRYDGEFRELASNLEKTVQCQDLREIRVRLTCHVGQLRASVDHMRSDQEEALRPLQTELKSYEQRLAKAELLAATDPLTGLINRRGAEKWAEERVRMGIPFCLFVVDLNRFKGINDRFGHNCGDQVLKLVARRLENQVRARDIVCRWGGDEFVILLECRPSEAMQRSREFAQCIQGRFPVTANGHSIELDISSSVGVAQCHPGESLEAAFERADGMLYQMKQRA